MMAEEQKPVTTPEGAFKAVENRPSPAVKSRRGFPIVEGILMLTFLVTLLTFWEFSGWLGDLASHFRLQCAVLFALLFVITLIRKQPQWILLAVIGFWTNIGEVLPAWMPQPEVTPATSVVGRLKILHMNVLLGNHNFKAVSDAIRWANADLVSLHEVDPNYLAQLKPVLKGYPYHHAFVRPGRYYGIALYSRVPLLKQNTHFFGGVHRPVLLDALKLQDEWVTVMVAHPLSPGKEWRYEKRLAQMDGIAAERRHLGQNLIMVGDLNNTPYSVSFKRFLSQTGLRDSREGFGYQASWPVWMPPLQIPIDHVLVSERFSVLNRQIGPFMGSDHLPVLTEVALHAAPKPSALETLPDIGADSE